MIHTKTQSTSRKGYLLHSVLFFVLIISLTDSLIRKASNIYPYRKLQNRLLARWAYTNLKEGTTKECLLSEKTTLKKTAINGSTTTWVRAVRNGKIANIYYESLCGEILQQTLDHIGPYGRESIIKIQIIKNPGAAENPGMVRSSNRENTFKRNRQMKILLKKQIERAATNLPYLKTIREETIEQLYKGTEVTAANSEKWEKEIKRGVKATLENLKTLICLKTSRLSEGFKYQKQ